MTKGQKIGLWIGGFVLAAGIGIGIYASTRKKVAPGTGTGGTGSGGGTSSGPPKPDSNLTNLLNKAMSIANTIRTYTAEKFPLKPGMKGDKVKSLQMALRVNFNQLSVSNDGLFGFKTAQALKNIGYTNALINGVSFEDFNNILDGKAPY